MNAYHVSIQQAQSYIFVFYFSELSERFSAACRPFRKAERHHRFHDGIGSLDDFPSVCGIAYGVLALIGVVLMSSFSVTVVYAQELVPGKIGTMSGLTVGLAFGMGAIGAVALGALIDSAGLTPTMTAVAFLPVLGLLAFVLPSDKTLKEWHS